MKQRDAILLGVSAAFLVAAISVASMKQGGKSKFLGSAEDNAKAMIEQGRNTFRFDTYGDEAFWTGQLHIQQSVKTLPPSTALMLGLKVDSAALSPATVQAIRHGMVNLNDPAVTLQLIK